MGRHSGYLAANAALAMNDANFVLVPEVPFELEGPKGLLEALRVLEGVGEIGFVRFSSADVVRHPLVARIVEAYDADGNAGQ